MAYEKKISAKEAAVAVLEKAKEMLKNSALAKAEKLSKDDGTINSQIGFPFGKNEKPASPHAHQKDVGEPDGVKAQVAPENDPHVQAANNNAQTAAGMPGSLKLAKFMGHMEAKRKMKAPAPAAAPAMPAAEVHKDKIPG